VKRKRAAALAVAAFEGNVRGMPTVRHQRQARLRELHQRPDSVMQRLRRIVATTQSGTPAAPWYRERFHCRVARQNATRVPSFRGASPAAGPGNRIPQAGSNWTFPTNRGQRMTVFLIRLAAMVTGSLALAGAAAAAAVNWSALGLIGIDGKPLPEERFTNKVVLVVNTASLCGFTPQYKGLQTLWERYRDRGLVVLGVPSNDFGHQEPGSEAKIKDFCEVNFGVNFPMTAKQTVRGPAAHPLYRWAEAEGGSAAVPGWNFHKLLVGRDGRLVGTFPSQVEPTAPEVTRAIESALR
jgi:glutathione peroxidase